MSLFHYVRQTMYTSILTYRALVFPVSVCMCFLWGECLQWLNLIQGLIYNRFPGDTNDDLAVEIKLFLGLAGSKTCHDYPTSLDASHNRTQTHIDLNNTNHYALFMLSLFVKSFW